MPEFQRISSIRYISANHETWLFLSSHKGAKTRSFLIFFILYFSHPSQMQPAPRQRRINASALLREPYGVNTRAKPIEELFIIH